MKNIIVPTDFSKQAGYALDFASEIAMREGTAITLLHVVEYSKKETVFLEDSSLTTMATLPEETDEEDIFFLELYKKRKFQIEEVLNDPKYIGVDIKPKIVLGTPYHAIAEEITNIDADLIIMGTTGISDWEESLIGSTAEKVVRNAACPVLTLRQPLRLEDVNDIVYASDFHLLSGSHVPIIEEMQRFFSARMHFLYINSPNYFKNEKEIRETILSFAKHNGFDNYEIHIYAHRHRDEGIIEFSKDNNMDVVMMATHGRTGLSRLFEHSIAEDVVNYSQKPVVTFNLHHLK